MSDETPYDDWLSSASPDREETQQADELETFLSALPRVNPDDGSRLSDNAPRDAQVSDERLATMLFEVSEAIAPDADFSANLQTQIERQIRERSRVGTVETDGTEHDGRAVRLRTNMRRYRPLLAALAALLLVTLLVALPPVQATLRRPLCLGSVCIVTGGSPPSTAGPHVSPTPLSSMLNLAGRTSLAQARAQATFPIRLPTYPADLGRPDYVFLQDLDGAAVVLVWVDHAHPDQVRMSISELSSGVFAYKFASQPVEVTTVHGQKALWTTGPYIVELQDGSYDTRRFVTGHALIWTDGSITYRLETSGSLGDAVRIAESLR